MDEQMLVLSLAAFTLVAGLCSVLFNKLKLPPLIGYLIAGIVLANMWNISEEGGQVISVLSDMGLVLLMFCIGLEINLRRLRKQGMFAIMVCMVQMPIILIGGFVAGELMGMTLVQSLVLGAVMSGSSTAVVLAVLKAQNFLDKEHTESIILVLIIEDIGQVILLSMLGPMMNGTSMSPDSMLIMILSIIIFMALAIFIGLRLLPPFINWISDNVSKEVTIILVLGLAFAMAYLSMLVGLSLAIGAFLMGMIVASTRKSRDIHHAIEPMENLFMAMFFISVGMEVSLGSFVDNIMLTIGIYLLFLFLKIGAVYFGYFTANEKGRICWLSAVSLTVMGEFAFIIAKEALGYSVIDQSLYTSIVGAALISMIALPVIAKFAEKTWDTADAKCPQGIRKHLDKVVARRDSVYDSFTSASTRSRNALRRSMAYAYVNILLIVIIQTIFFLFTATIGDWLNSKISALSAHEWCMVLMVANFLLLFIPTHQLVSNVKALDELVVKGSRYMTKSSKAAHKSYQSLLEFNSILLAFFIVTLIIAIIPNPLGNYEHFILFALAAASLLFVWGLSVLKKRTERKNAELGFGVEEEEEEEEAVRPRQPAARGSISRSVPVRVEQPKEEERMEQPVVQRGGSFEKHTLSDDDEEIEIFIHSNEPKLRVSASNYF